MTRPEYLARARATARLLLESRDEITINDVREHCPPPPHWDGRVLGAVFKHPDFESTGRIVKSNRSTCHKRPIQLFRRSAA
ncbi:MAG: hypothetical protein AAFP81_17460, partial [Pseudomonadota bacterium]